MPAPLVAIGLAAAAKIAAKKIIKSKAKTTVVRPKPKTASAETVKTQKASVKKLPSKTAPKTGIENRGNKVSRNDRAETAKEMLWNKGERSYEGSIDIMATGMKGPKMGAPKAAGKKNQKKIDNLKKAAKTPIKINSSNLKPNRIIKKSK